MKLLKLLLVVLLLGTSVVGDAMAGRGHGHHHHGPRIHFGLGFGPFWGPWYPPSYYAPVVVQQVQPPVYIEQAADSGPANFWYYCAAARGYYPYVKDCPAGWQKVAPRPEDQP